MTDPTPIHPDPSSSQPTRISVARYCDLVATGVLEEDDRVELLEGVIVAMPPPNPPHAGVVTAVTYALIRAVGDRGVVRTQCSFQASEWSMPEPDVAVVGGRIVDQLSQHPRSAHLIVEVADSSLKQDRLSKSRIYAAAGVPEYWIVNLRDGVLEVFRDPDPGHALYRAAATRRRGEEIELAALPDVRVAVGDLMPAP
jgi:Uma2 family endonuclease